VLTTLHTQYEREIKALLRIPDTVETAALIPVGYPTEGSHFGRARRRPLSEVVFHGSCTRPLRIIILPPKPGTMPPT